MPYDFKVINESLEKAMSDKQSSPPATSRRTVRFPGGSAHDNYKLWEPQPDPATIAKCPICNSRAEAWQYSAKPDAQLMRVVMCTNGDPFGPQIRDGSGIMGGCILYMPPDDFYRARTVEAVQYWNDYAEALLSMRSETASRSAVLEEAARVCERQIPKDAGSQLGPTWMPEYSEIERCAAAIRALKGSPAVTETAPRAPGYSGDGPSFKKGI